MLLWRIGWREMRRHPGRALLTWLSVVIGVAAVLSIGLSTGTARRAYQQMRDAISGGVGLELTGVGGEKLPAAYVPELEKEPGVKHAIPLIQRSAVLVFGDQRMRLLALGIDVERDAFVRDFEVVAGEKLTTSGGLLLDESIAENFGVKVGDGVRLMVSVGFATVPVKGIVRPRTGAAVASGGLVFMPLATAQQRFNAPDQVDRIQLILSDGVDVDALRASLVSQLPEWVVVEPPSTQSTLARETMLALENGLRLAAAFSLLAAIFIIMNTFSMNVGQRRKWLAVMRAIGATKWQISGLIFREALLLGVLGTGAGLLVGAGGASWLNGALGSLFQTKLPGLQWQTVPLLTAIGFGLGISLLGALLPARMAAQFTPLEGIRGLAPQQTETQGRWIVWAGALLFLVSTSLFAICVLGWIAFENAVLFVVVMLLSLVMLLPLVQRPLIGLGQLLLRPCIGIEARLANRQLLRHAGRTSLTIGVLFVAVSTGLGLANSVLDNVNDVRRWYRETILGDFFVRAAMPDMESGTTASVPQIVGDELFQVPGIDEIATIRFVSVKVDEEQAIAVVTGLPRAAPRSTPRSYAAFSPPPGEQILLGSVLAQRLGKKVGDTVMLETLNGPLRLPIAAVSNDYVGGGLTIHVNIELARRLLNVEGVDAYVIRSNRQNLPTLERDIRALCAKHGMLFQSYADLTGIIEGMMAGVVGSLWGLLILGLIVASFGVVNTLGMNVLEQTRELGLLRVIAMTRSQVRRVIVAQAAMLGLVGVVPGLLAGFAMAYIINLSTLPVIGHPVAFSPHPWLWLGGFLAAMGMVILAAWAPAERAARLKVQTALRYE